MVAVPRVLAFVVSAVLFAGPVRAELIYGIEPVIGNAPNFSLIDFDSATPNTVNTIGLISGLSSGAYLRAIDFRPSNGKLYALAAFPNTGLPETTVELYTIDLGTGRATTVAGLITLDDRDTIESIDFDPVSGALRIVGGSGQSDRIDADTGLLIATDPFITNDPNPTEGVYDIAYGNNVVGATSSTLYGYDAYNDLITIDPASGTFTTVGPSGVISRNNYSVSLDISGATGRAYSALSVSNPAGGVELSEFFTVDLATGAYTPVAYLDYPLTDLSVAPAASTVPEPGSLALLGIGALPFMVRRRRAKGSGSHRSA